MLPSAGIINAESGSGYSPIGNGTGSEGYYVDYSQVPTGTAATPEDYGAAGDGVTPDRDAVQQCINENQVVELQSGSTYLLEGQLWCNGVSNRHIFGGGTIKVQDSGIGAGNYALRMDGDNVHLENVVFDGNTATTQATGACYLVGISNLSIRDCEFKNWGDHDGVTDQPHAVSTDGCSTAEILRNHIHDCGAKGVSWYAQSGDPVPHDVLMRDNLTERTGEEGLFAGNESGAGRATGIIISHNEMRVSRSQYLCRIGGSDPVDVEISENLVVDGYHAGITAKTLGATNATIRDNELCRCGINLRATNDSAPVTGTVEGNIIKDSTHGIQVLSACDSVDVDSNYTDQIRLEGGSGHSITNNHWGTGLVTVNSPSYTQSGNTADYDHSAETCSASLPGGSGPVRIAWSSVGDWDRATSETGVVHESVANTDHGDASVLKLGYSAASPFLAADLQGYWALHEDASTTAFDFSGNGYDGTVSGATLGVTGLLGTTAYSFDGVDDSVTADPFWAAAESDPITWMAWVKLPDTASDGDFANQIIYQGSDAENGGMMVDSSGSVAIYSAGANSVGTGTLAVDDGTWHHVAAVYDQPNDFLSVYRDGQHDYSISYTDNLVLGANPIATLGSFDGDSGGVWVYSRALTQAEVQTHADIASAGSLTTATKSMGEAAQPSLTNLAYSLNGQSIDVTVTGSPGTASEESVTQSLGGATSYSLGWSSSHTDFRVTVDFATSDVTQTATLDSLALSP